MKNVIAGIVSFIVVVAIVLGICCCTSVPTGHTGVLTSFGKVTDTTLESGFHFKPFWMKVVKMDNRIQKETIDLSCFSSDIQEVSMLYTINYQIDSTNAMNIYKTIGKDYYDKVIAPAIAESTKVVTARYPAEGLISSRDEVAVAIEEDLATKLSDYNIILVATSIEDMDFTDAFTNAVEEKQVAQQNKLKAQTQAEQKVIEAQADADVQKVKADAKAYQITVDAEAQAAANEMISKSLTDNILLKIYYDKWDGDLPMYMIGDESSTSLLIPPPVVAEE